MEKRTPNPSIYFHVHLVSDSTGETLSAVMKASCAQFSKATPLEHVHTLVRTEKQIENVLNAIVSKPGVVFYTLMNSEYRKMLETMCFQNNIRCISILDPSVAMVSEYLGALSLEKSSEESLTERDIETILESVKRDVSSLSNYLDGVRPIDVPATDRDNREPIALSKSELNELQSSLSLIKVLLHNPKRHSFYLKVQSDYLDENVSNLKTRTNNMDKMQEAFSTTMGKGIAGSMLVAGGAIATYVFGQLGQIVEALRVISKLIVG